MYSLKQILNQAWNHRKTAYAECSREKFAILHGVKISYDKLTRDITLYNTTIGGDNYVQLSHDQVQRFRIGGWIYGVNNVRIENYLRKLSIIDRRINTLLNKKNFSDRKFNELKTARDRYMMLYADAIKRLEK
jgi:hypothetical protein